MGNTLKSKCFIIQTSSLPVFKARREVKYLSTEVIKRKIASAKSAGAKTIILADREPARREDIEQLVKYIHQKKMLSGIFTGGEVLAEPSNLHRLCSCGLKVVIFNFKKMRLGKPPSSKIRTEKSIRGLINAFNMNREIFVRYHINPDELEATFRIIDILATIKIMSVQLLYNPSIEYRQKATLEVISYHIKRAIEYALLRNLDISIAETPPCIIKGYENFASDPFEEAVLITGENNSPIPIRYLNKVHIPGCKECIERQSCSGIHARYLKLKGEADIEFSPYTQKDKDESLTILNALSHSIHKRWRQKFVKFARELSGFELISSRYRVKFASMILNLEFSVVVGVKKSPVRFSFKTTIHSISKIRKCLGRLYGQGLYNDKLLKTCLEIAHNFRVNVHCGFEFGDREPVFKIYFNREIGCEEDFELFIQTLCKTGKVQISKIPVEFFILAFSFTPDRKVVTKFYYRAPKLQRYLSKFNLQIKESTSIVSLKFLSSQLIDILVHKNIRKIDIIRFPKVKTKFERLCKFYGKFRKSVIPIFYSHSVMNVNQSKEEKLYYIVRG